MPDRVWIRALSLAVASLSACTGTIGNPGGADLPPGTQPPVTPPNTPPGTPPPVVVPPGTPPPIDETCQTTNAGPAPMRRLSNAEYRYTIEDLFGRAELAAEVTRTFVPETESLGFRNSAEFLQVPQLIAQQFMDAAESVSVDAAQNAGIIPCNVASGDAACASTFIRNFGKRVYRRPLAAEELARYESIYSTAAMDYDFATGIEWIVYAMLQSPHFLYRVEMGVATGSAYARLDGWETASRLSYLLWQSMPDDALFAAAEQGRLSTKEEIETQARRMLADPKARRGVEFFEQWLDVDQVASVQRDRNVFPEFSNALATSLAEETRRFVEYVIFEGDARLETLFTAPYSFVDSTLATHYGVAPPNGGGWARVDFDRSRRAGVFTQGAFMAVHDKPTRTSIVRRGLKIRTDFLCQQIGAPPDNVNTDLPPLAPDATQRQRLEMHRRVESCAGCHNLMDPIGVMFEHYDALGRFRDVDEVGVPVDSNSELTFTEDVDGAVTGATALASRLANSEQVRACVATQMFRFSMGRAETPADKCSQDQLAETFAATGYDLSELLVALTQTDSFTFMPAIAP